MTNENITYPKLKFSKDADNAKLKGMKAWLPINKPKIYSLSL